MSVPSALDNLVTANGLPSTVLWQRQTASEGWQGLTELGCWHRRFGGGGAMQVVTAKEIPAIVPLPARKRGGLGRFLLRRQEFA